MQPSVYHSRYEIDRHDNRRLLIAVVMIASLIFIPIVIVPLFSNYVANTSEYRHGSFTPGSIHVVDGETSNDIIECVAEFSVYVTNDTETFDTYMFLGSGTTLNNVRSTLSNIGDDVYYTSVVMWTIGMVPYNSSWDIITEGDNYIYLYK
jgi:hypothetical protein